jgi:ribosomal RNA assembly protein|tara:strand:+ start:27 stop:557 length:531 start_codon:yes stop_codon:yes gene_type:complete
MYEEEIKVPKERIAILIGKKGELKRELEKITKTKIYIDSNNNLVTLKAEDSINLFNALPIIKAIARGFNPDIAELLNEEDYTLEVIDIKNFSGDSKKKLIRLKSRCIGTSGKARENIEQLTNTHISVYGKTVSIIGRIENVGIARFALESILSGSPHGKVYKKIQERKSKSIDLSD